jgi:pyruvate dehydrogenase E2 component (dihydrolipoamide acetyltransferase)
MTTFKLPDLGEGLAEAEIVTWHVAVGDTVSVDQPMVSVETAKAVVDLPVPFSGVVERLHAGPGDIVPTGAPLIDVAPTVAASTATGAGRPDATAANSATVVGTVPSSDEELIETFSYARPPAAAPVRGRAVPVARALAKRLGLELDSVTGSGPGGLITLDDVLASANVSATPPAIAKMAAQAHTEPTPLRGSRRAMAHTMTLARDQIALSTVCDDADIEVWGKAGRQGGGYTLRLMRALARACIVEPALNAWYDANENARLVLKHVDLGVAVDTPGGLIVPVLRNIQAKSPDELRAALATQKEAAHQRALTGEDLRDFTLMLSNFGTLAGRYGIPQVVPPAVAILGAGKVRPDAVVVDGRVEAHLRMPLSLSFDHRCVTGGEACRFLAAVIADLESAE